MFAKFELNTTGLPRPPRYGRIQSQLGSGALRRLSSLRHSGRSVTCRTVKVGRGSPGLRSRPWRLTHTVAARPALMPPWMSAFRLSPTCTACAGAYEHIEACIGCKVITPACCSTLMSPTEVTGHDIWHVPQMAATS